MDYWKELEQISPDIVYHSTCNTILFSQINKFFTFVKFLNYFFFSIKLKLFYVYVCQNCTSSAHIKSTAV
jgi:hypothetical protein